MSKQPGQIRADYTKTEEILTKCENRITGGYKDKKTVYVSYSFLG